MLKKAFLKSSVVVVCLGALACTVPCAAAGITIARQPWSGETDLSSDPGAPTVLLWAKPGAVLLAINVDGVSEPTSKDSKRLAAQITAKWFARDSSGQERSFPTSVAVWNDTIYSWADPVNKLDEGRYTLWFTLADKDGTVASQQGEIYVKMPTFIEHKYHPALAHFKGILVHGGRTAFTMHKKGNMPNPILDTPNLYGGDNPAMFYHDGTMYFIFGDPKTVDRPGNAPSDEDTRQKWPCGVLAFTRDIVPEKGIDLAHDRHWVMDPKTGCAKSLVTSVPNHPNCTGAAVIERPSGRRLWFAHYTRRKPGEYANYKLMGIVYSDDFCKTSAVQADDLILWERDDTETVMPDPFLGYPMRLFKGYVYLMIPRKKVPRGGEYPVLIRCKVEDLDNCALADWHHLISVDAGGVPKWSEKGLVKNQIADPKMPTVDFSGDPPGILNGLLWNPYMNRWVTMNAIGNLTVWEAKHIWGPYRNLDAPRRFPLRLTGGYNCFSHELMLGNNGEWIHYARARSGSRYGVFFSKVHMRDRLKITLSQKCATAGQGVTITCENRAELPIATPAAVTLQVDGNSAALKSQEGNRYVFTYQVTGKENNGKPGPVDVAAVMIFSEEKPPSYRVTRDVALIVNHINNIQCTVTSHEDGQTVGGTTFLDVAAAYDKGPEDLGAGRPVVRILKTELRALDGDKETVEDADVQAPYRLRLDTTRYANGTHSFKVIAYDMLDRRGVASIDLNIQNPAQPEAAGNLVADGNMEAVDVTGWRAVGNCELRKVTGRDHRTGVRSLLLKSTAPDEEAGGELKVTNLPAAGKLRFTAWTRLVASYYTAKLSWQILDAQGNLLAESDCTSYGYFRRVMHEFENPAGNSELVIRCTVKDPGADPSWRTRRFRRSELWLTMWFFGRHPTQLSSHPRT